MVNFSGTVSSDFLKLVASNDTKKLELINYAATDFLSLRDALIEYIKAAFPLDYHNFVESDQGMMLAELMSYVGAVASLKADMLANENYIKTARKRNSVRKLLELVGVSLRGPIAAAANAKVTWDTPLWASPRDDTEVLSIDIADRVRNITASEDGGPVSYTLYKVIPNGNVELANATGDIFLTRGETDDAGVLGKVHSNLVLLEGALVKETGSFADTESTKFIELSEGPVIEGSVDVFIAGDGTTSGVYEEVTNLYFASGATAKIYELAHDEAYNANIIFGDNTFGISPRAGDDYTVTYRVGGGTRGNMPNEYMNVSVKGETATGTFPGVLENTSQGTGGANAETLEHAKRYAPLTFRRQDRLVTLIDVDAFANSYITSYGSVGKATAATRKAYSSANIVDVYVLEKANDLQLRRATPAFKSALLNAMNLKKMITTEFVIVDGLIRTLDLVVTLSVDKELKPREPIIKLKAKDKILEYFHIDNMIFGKTFLPQDLNRHIFNIDEVRFSSIDNVRDPIFINFNEIVQLNNLSINVVYV